MLGSSKQHGRCWTDCSLLHPDHTLHRLLNGQRHRNELHLRLAVVHHVRISHRTCRSHHSCPTQKSRKSLPGGNIFQTIAPGSCTSSTNRHQELNIFKKSPTSPKNPKNRQKVAKNRQQTLKNCQKSPKIKKKSPNIFKTSPKIFKTLTFCENIFPT